MAILQQITQQNFNSINIYNRRNNREAYRVPFHMVVVLAMCCQVRNGTDRIFKVIPAAFHLHYLLTALRILSIFWPILTITSLAVLQPLLLARGERRNRAVSSQTTESQQSCSKGKNKGVGATDHYIVKRKQKTPTARAHVESVPCPP
ncbi:hypothetical protein JRQ81_001568 [Phrynocephalus forsythii]|uniref:Uncharacterized protein n=1 Tax=Phrynocephalus forsythii TaxID=171643 RepID=A0A9Q1B7Z6_9SAUR|nr:hypothetical protein JRQ81_001568 [Phrynocephalus forsythii]